MPEVLHLLCKKKEGLRWQRDLLAIADVKQQDDVWLRYAPGAPLDIAGRPEARKRSLIGGSGKPAGRKGKGKAKRRPLRSSRWRPRPSRRTQMGVRRRCLPLLFLRGW